MPLPNIDSKVPAFRADHRSMAGILIIFVAAHVANHLAALVSVSSHVELMVRLRTLYRTPIIEAALLGCIGVHIVSGLVLLGRGRKMRSGAIAWLQATSGGYLALFLIIHIVAVQYGRLALNLDTNFHFAAAGLHVSPFGYFFGPYYFLAILSLFIHVGCALSRFISHSTRIRGLTVAAFACAGAVAATVILASLMGLIHEYTVPQEYINTFMQE